MRNTTASFSIKHKLDTTYLFEQIYYPTDFYNQRKLLCRFLFHLTREVSDMTPTDLNKMWRVNRSPRGKTWAMEDCRANEPQIVNRHTIVLIRRI